MNHGSLFSGIGGFDLAASWLGWENLFQVEIDKFCRKVLKKNFPNTKRYSDIKKFDGKKYEGKIDVISGGFPCQPFSVAGKRRGKADDRCLWNEMLRVISEIKPSWNVIENVCGILTIENGLVFEQMQTDLENIGYETQTFIIPACGKNAPHRRNRIWLVTHCFTSDANSQRKLQQKGFEQNEWRWLGNYNQNENWLKVATEICGMDDGIPHRMDRIKSLSNAIVPQIAYEIFKIIDELQKLYKSQR